MSSMQGLLNNILSMFFFPLSIKSYDIYSSLLPRHNSKHNA